MNLDSEVMDKRNSLLVILLVMVNLNNYTQELITDDNFFEDGYYDFVDIEGITIIADRILEFTPESVEARILTSLNGSVEERRQIIQNDLLQNAGFRGTGNVRFRKTDTSEKVISLLGGLFRGLTFSFISPTEVPLLEIEYARLPRGEFYSFDSVIFHSELSSISPYVLNILRIEYMLQVEFGNGFLIEDTKRYYTE